MKTKSYWPHAIVCFLLLIAVLNGTLLYLASTTAPGLIESNPYEKGNAFQQQIDQREAAVTHDISLAAKLTSDSQGRPILSALVTQGGRAIQGARVVASFRNPAQQNRDRQIELIFDTAAYVTTLSEMSGNWLVTYTVLWEGKKLRFDNTLQVP